MTQNKYVVVLTPIGSEDLSHEFFDSLEEAEAFIDSIDDKAVLLTASVGCHVEPLTLTIDYHT